MSGRDHIMRAVLLPETQQEVHVTFSQEGLTRLKLGLERAGLDARFFAWPPDNDPQRSPYRGLKPLEAEDAGIFFGREARTIDALDRLRGLKDAAPPRFLVILGASGAGKSSYLRAGLLPRLARDDRHFLPLPVLRPERAAITGQSGLLSALEVAFAAQGLPVVRAEIRQAIEGGAPALRPLLTRLAEKARAAFVSDEGEARAPILVLAIDQGEELLQADGAVEGVALLALLKDLLAEDSPGLLVLATIRSDRYEQLQTATALEGVNQQTLSLPPMPRGAYQTIIEGPAQRLKDTGRPLTIEPALSQALLADIDEAGGRDALPLLAFTLERLFVEYGARGRLALADYVALGRIKGSIESAVERTLEAADSDPAIPRDRAARLALIRRGLIPALASVDPDTGASRRRVVRRSEIPADALSLIDLLIEQRLLSTDKARGSGEATMEPAHEAFLRQWGPLVDWLNEDAAALAALEGVQRAARDWDAKNRSADWLAHSAGRLEDAETLLKRNDFARFLAPADRDYLDACRAGENERRNRELKEARKLASAQKKIAQRTLIGLIAASIFLVGAVGAAWFGFDRAHEAKQQAAIALQSSAEAQKQSANALKSANDAKANLVTARANFTSALAGLSSAESEHRPVNGAKLALAAWPRKGAMDLPKRDVTLDAVSRSLDGLDERARIITDARVNSVAFSPDGARVLTGSTDNTARLWDAATGKEIRVFKGHEGGVWSVAFSRDGARVLTGSVDATARLWDAATGKEIRAFKGHEGFVRSVAFSPDGARVLTGSVDATARLWDAATGKEIRAFTGHEGPVFAVAFSPDGARVLTGSYDNTARLWDAATGKEIRAFTGHEGYVLAVAFSPDGARVLTGSEDNTARLWGMAVNGDAIYEPFSGPGTTVIAGEMTGCRVLTIELSPVYVDDPACGGQGSGRPATLTLVALGRLFTRMSVAEAVQTKVWVRHRGATLGCRSPAPRSTTCALAPPPSG
jgi:DNA-binding beta-propeller fold protein YncE